MNALEIIEKEHVRGDIPDFKTGDTLKVHVKIVEGQKQRIQVFEGVVIRKKKGNSKSKTYKRTVFVICSNPKHKQRQG